MSERVNCRHEDDCGPCQDDLEAKCAEIARLRALVKAAECPNEDQCPWCWTYTQPGFADPHKPDCPAFWPDGRVR